MATLVVIRARPGDQRSLLFAMETMRSALVHIVGQVRSGTDTIATASSQIAAGNLDLSSRTEEQASSLEETASSMEELTSTVRQVGLGRGRARRRPPRKSRRGSTTRSRRSTPAASWSTRPA